MEKCYIKFKPRRSSLVISMHYILLFNKILAGQRNGDIVLYRKGMGSSDSFSSGRVLIYSKTGSYEGFGSVKNDVYFDLKAATVICQQLQFDGAYGYSDTAEDS